MKGDWKDVKEHLNDPFLPLPDDLDCEICQHKMRIVNDSDIPSTIYNDESWIKKPIKIDIPTKSRIYVCDNCYARVGKSSQLGEIVTNELRHYLRKDK